MTVSFTWPLTELTQTLKRAMTYHQHIFLSFNPG